MTMGVIVLMVMILIVIMTKIIIGEKSIRLEKYMGVKYKEPCMLESVISLYGIFI